MATTDKITFFEKGEIESDIAEIERLLGTGRLQSPDVRILDKNADFTWLMICLRDLLAKAEKFSERVSFSDDVIPMWAGKAEVADVTGLVKCFRDAMCHRDSFRELVGSKMRLSLGIGWPGDYTMIKTSEFESPKNDYEDDFMFICGPQRIYFQRHAVRAFEEARTKLQSVLSRLGPIDMSTGEHPIL